MLRPILSVEVESVLSRTAELGYERVRSTLTAVTFIQTQSLKSTTRTHHSEGAIKNSWTLHNAYPSATPADTY